MICKKIYLNFFANQKNELFFNRKLTFFFIKKVSFTIFRIRKELRMPSLMQIMQ